MDHAEEAGSHRQDPPVDCGLAVDRHMGNVSGFFFVRCNRLDFFLCNCHVVEMATCQVGSRRGLVLHCVACCYCWCWRWRCCCLPHDNDRLGFGCLHLLHLQVTAIAGCYGYDYPQHFRLDCSSVVSKIQDLSHISVLRQLDTDH